MTIVTFCNFGTAVNEETGNTEDIIKYTFKNNKNVTVQVINYGANITNVILPDKNGELVDVVLGFDTIDGYLVDKNSHIGATIGRYANRIKNATFVVDGETYHVSKNAGENQLHGGFKGFDKKIWNSCLQNDSVVFSYVSKDGEEGYPGDVLVNVIYHLNDENQLSVEMSAVCSRPCPVNLTNHSYFNLNGFDAGKDGLYDHDVVINADNVTELDSTQVATGRILPVEGGNYNFKINRNLGEAIQNSKDDGIDINYCINGYCQQQVIFASRVSSRRRGIYLDIHTNQPGIQFYTANSLSTENGKNNSTFGRHSSFCLETQNYPNAINIESFPNSILRPGDEYKHKVIYSFGVTD